MYGDASLISVPDRVKAAIPSPAKNQVAEGILGDIEERVLDNATVLVVGCGDGGSVQDGCLKSFISDNIVASDVIDSEFSDMKCDLHDLPYQSESVDGIICQAVLEHVEDANAAINEMTRVLKPGGYLFIDVPFLQPYHAFPYDFRRYTVRGLENKLDHLQKLYSGASVGLRRHLPGSSRNIWDTCSHLGT